MMWFFCGSLCVYNDEGQTLRYRFYKNHVKGGPYCQFVSLFDSDKAAC